MPGGRKMIVVNGRRASVPEDQFQNAMRYLDSSGVSFEIADPSGGGQPPPVHQPAQEPLRSPASPAPEPEFGPEEELGALDRWINGAKETAGDALRGLNSGLYWGGSDEVEALSPGRTLEQARASNAEAEARSPWAYNMSKAAGYIPGALMTGARTAAAGLGVLGRAGMAAAEGLGMGALESEEETAAGVAGDALQSAAISGGGGFALDAAGMGARALGRGADNAGVALRRANAGGSQGELDAIRQQDGIDYMQTGLDQRFDELGLAGSPGFWNRDGWKPRSAYDTAKLIEGKQAAAGQRMGGALDEAGARGVQGDWDEIDETILQKLVDGPENMVPTSKQQKEDAALTGLYRDFQGISTPHNMGSPASPRALHRQKVAYEDAGKYPDGTVQLLADEPLANANRTMANATRAELDDTMHSAGPDVYQDFRRGSEDYGDLAQFGAMAGKRAAGNKAGSGASSPWTWGGGVAGAGIGGAMGGPLGIPAGLAMGAAGNGMARNYGQDVAGIGMRKLVAPGLNSAGSGMRSAAPAMPFIAGNSGDDPTAGGNYRGDLVPDVVNRIYSQNSDAFGPYRLMFQEAVSSGDPRAVSALLERLEADPEWTNEYMPRLAAMTRELGNAR